MQKVLIINQVCGPMCIDIANAFVDRGYLVHLVTGSIEPTYALLREEIQTKKFIKYRREKALYRLTTWMLFFIQISIYLIILKRRTDRILVVSNPPMMSLISLFPKFLLKSRIDLLVYDIYPDILVGLGYQKNDSIIVRLWKSLNKISFLRMRRIITLNHDMAGKVKQYAPSKDIEVIPCWVDTSKLKPIIPKADNWFAIEYNQVGKITVLYSGNIGLAHDIETIIEAGWELRDANNIHFLIIGEGSKKLKIERLIESLGLNNITLLSWQDPEVVPYSMACGDIAIVTTADGVEASLIPSKTFYYLATGNFVIGLSNRMAQFEEMIDEGIHGRLVSNGDAAALSMSIRLLADMELDKIKMSNHNSAKIYSIHQAYRIVDETR